MNEHAFPFTSEGMLLRDFFAASIMAGASDKCFGYREDDTQEHIELTVAMAYRVADAMIEERKKKK